MNMFSRFIQIAFSFLIIAVIALLLLLLLYGIIRLLRLSERWIIRVMQASLVVESVLCAVFLLQQTRQADRVQTLGLESQLLGFASCLVIVYSFSQWGSRALYRLIKQRAATMKALSRNVLLFFRRYHNVFGWLVLITAMGHAIMLLPAYARYSLQAFLSGTLALVLLGVLVVLGISIERAIRQKRLSAKTRMFHVATAATFFATLLLHLTIR